MLNTMGGGVDPTLVSQFAYTYDEAARRTDRTDTFGGNTPVDNSFGYNPRSEVTSAMFGTDSYSYDFDDIGNRISHTIAPEGSNGAQQDYFANELNQYDLITNNQEQITLSYDSDGNMESDGNLTYAWNGECTVSVLLFSSEQVRSAGKKLLNNRTDTMLIKYGRSNYSFRKRFFDC